ncbi:MAG: dihydroorotase [Ignavibacteria bacterium]|nr:dihydroorotase [Ignavibacteria bacterium]
MTLYFKNIRIISPLQEIDNHCNMLINDGVIDYIGTAEPVLTNDVEQIDATNLIACPGMIDMHVHLREPGQEYKETIATGTQAAANGGYTAVVCMPNTLPAVDSVAVLEYITSRTNGNLVDVYTCATITKGRDGKELAPLLSLLEAGAVMFSDDGSCLESAEMMRRAFDYTSEHDALLTQHCEEHTMTRNFAMNEGTVSAELGLKGYPTVAEDVIIARDILLAEYCGNRRYHAAHISTKGAVRIIREAKSRGMRVSCEVTPHHFVLTDEAVRGYNTNAKMNPPLRSMENLEAIIEGLHDGTIDCIATDHAPHAIHEKECEFSNAANGITGLETALGLGLTYLVHTGKLTIGQLIEKMSINPRKVLHLPQVNVKVGERANLTVFDPSEVWNVDLSHSCSKSQNSPFHGVQLTGKPKYSINNGQVFRSRL